ASTRPVRSCRYRLYVLRLYAFMGTPTACLTLALTCRRKPKRRRSVATVLVVKGAWSIFLVLHLLRLPGCPRCQQSMEKGPQLRHTRGQSDFFAVSCGEEPRGKRCALRVVARGDEGPQVEHGAHRRPPAPERAPTTAGPPVAMAGRHPDAGRAVLPCARPQRGPCPPHRAGTARVG